MPRPSLIYSTIWLSLNLKSIRIHACWSNIYYRIHPNYLLWTLAHNERVRISYLSVAQCNRKMQVISQGNHIQTENQNKHVCCCKNRKKYLLIVLKKLMIIVVSIRKQQNHSQGGWRLEMSGFQSSVMSRCHTKNFRISCCSYSDEYEEWIHQTM